MKQLEITIPVEYKFTWNLQHLDKHKVNHILSVIKTFKEKQLTGGEVKNLVYKILTTNFSPDRVYPSTSTSTFNSMFSAFHNINNDIKYKGIFKVVENSAILLQETDEIEMISKFFSSLLNENIIDDEKALEKLFLEL